MRAIALAFGCLALSACAGSVSVPRAYMPLEILRSEGERPRLYPVVLVAGEFSKTSPYVFRIWFDHNEGQLGEPRMVGWSMQTTAYCRDHPSWVRSVLIGPDGQRWVGGREYVPAGPDRHDNWAGGPEGGLGEGIPVPAGLLDAVSKGGIFTLSLEDESGGSVATFSFDTLVPRIRQRLFAANYKALLATDPNLPVTEQMTVVLGPEAPPGPSRPCP